MAGAPKQGTYHDCFFTGLGCKWWSWLKRTSSVISDVKSIIYSSSFFVYIAEALFHTVQVLDARSPGSGLRLGRGGGHRCLLFSIKQHPTKKNVTV